MTKHEHESCHEYSGYMHANAFSFTDVLGDSVICSVQAQITRIIFYNVNTDWVEMKGVSVSPCSIYDTCTKLTSAWKVVVLPSNLHARSSRSPSR